MGLILAFVLRRRCCNLGSCSRFIALGCKREQACGWSAGGASFPDRFSSCADFLPNGEETQSPWGIAIRGIIVTQKIVKNFTRTDLVLCHHEHVTEPAVFCASALHKHFGYAHKCETCRNMRT